MGSDIVHAQSSHIVESGGKSVCGDVVGGACFELERQLLKHCALKAHALNHLTSALVWGQTVEPFFLTVEHTDACRPVNLVSAEGEEVAVHSLYVYSEVGSRLCSVHHHWHTVGVGDAHYLVDGVYRAECVAHMCHADELRLLRKQILVCLHVEFAGVAHGYNLQGDATLCCLQLPRHDVGVVLHDADNDLVALAHKRLAERRHDEVDALCGAACEDDLFCLGRVDEPSHGLARRFVEVGGTL